MQFDVGQQVQVKARQAIGSIGTIVKISTPQGCHPIYQVRFPDGCMLGYRDYELRYPTTHPGTAQVETKQGTAISKLEDIPEEELTMFQIGQQVKTKQGIGTIVSAYAFRVSFPDDHHRPAQLA